MRHARCAAQHMANPVAGAFVNARTGTDDGHPSPQLAIESRIQIGRVFFDGTQPTPQQAQGLK